jgi:hypothetical protein
MANATVKVTLTQEDGNTVSKDKLLVVQNILSADASGTKVVIRYKEPGSEDGQIKTFVTGTLTVDQLNSAINDLAIPGAREVLGIITATGGKAIGTYDVLDLAGNAIILPVASRVYQGTYEVTTTFTSATDAGAIALSIATDDVAGLKASTAISVGTTYDAAAPKFLIQDGGIANISEKTTGARAVQYTIASEALTAGVMYVWLKVVTSA